MKAVSRQIARALSQVGPRFLPFADAATRDLPLGRLLRLSLFQLSVGMAIVLLTGTLNRVMIVELGLSAALVALMVALPVLFAPFRVLIGHRSDTHRSALGWRRVPYIWIGTLMQFGGLAFMPFALLLMSTGGEMGPEWAGPAAAALAFFLTGAGLHTTQTAGLALATDLAPEDKRPRVVALLYTMLLVGMLVSALTLGVLLIDFSEMKLIQVIQGAAVVTFLVNCLALWKQEARNPARTSKNAPRQPFKEAWRNYMSQSHAARFLVVVGLGTAGFQMQDILLEPYGGEILGLSVSATTTLTALLAGGTLASLALAAWWLNRGGNPYRLSALGALIGIGAFTAVILAAPMDSALLFRIGATCIGFGTGFFAVGTLIAAMSRENGGQSGIALGAWGAVQATALGLGIILGGVIRDIVNAMTSRELLGPSLTGPEIGYAVVYHIEIVLLLATLVAIGPLVRSKSVSREQSSSRFGMADFPG
ncbi:photosynthetic complex (LH1) assembly protein LhaA [Ectothiorhodospira sp. PHS-1]|uniref:BCD family MFS transporter n=1 Tax=Ectothiorhodospira sp. PHS-1 TaxID=519989 RepID=UPI00024A8208|nr:BCD family MFS transporter [Ectothiorhodospira sp. PHS-1]EHQ52647.1 photosynthetic complex (LH1) assembly protein LhaA [Ectothiorhodospira sp. PHS-1]